jgi:hypothetical protein
MRNLIIAFLTVLAVMGSPSFDTESACAEDRYVIPSADKITSAFINEGMVDGKVWNSFDEKQKIAYLYGYEEGVMNTAIHYIQDEEKRDDAIYNLPTSVAEISTAGLSVAIDDFYSEEKNLDIAISYVITITRNRLIGTPEEKIQRYIEYLRGERFEDLKKVIEKE